MDYFKINYNRMLNLRQKNFYVLIVIIIILCVIIIIASLNIKIDQREECYGIFNNNILKVKINSKLSDKIKSSKYIIFNNTKTNFKINKYDSYEIINNEIYQDIELLVDKKFYDNEIGMVKFYYGKKSIFYYFLDLFK